MKLTADQRAEVTTAIEKLQGGLDAAPRGHNPDARDRHARDLLVPLNREFAPLALALTDPLIEERTAKARAAIAPFCDGEVEVNSVFSELSIPRSLFLRNRHLRQHRPALSEAPGEARLIISLLNTVLEMAEA